MSYVQVRDNLDLYEYWKLLAVACEAEERADYNFASLVNIGFNNPKAIKKLRPDTSVTANPVNFLTGLAASMSDGEEIKPTGTPEDYARHTGRRIIYATDSGYVDEAGNLTTRERSDLVLQKPTVVN